MLNSNFGGSCQKYHFCRSKHVFVATTNKQTSTSFVATKGVYRDKGFISTSILLSRQKTCFVVASTCLSRQKHACRHKTFVKIMFVAINICRDKRFVATKQTIFTRQNFCHRHTVVTTKNVFVATKFLPLQK